MEYGGVFHDEEIIKGERSVCNVLSARLEACVSGVFEGVHERTYPFSVSVRRCVSPSISKILTVRSDEHVASLRP